MAEPPDGTVTLLFTDLESSTQLLRILGDGYAAVLSEHQRLIRAAVAAHAGYEVDTQGDAFFVAFSRATDAVTAVCEAQRTLEQHSWPAGSAVRVRMGLHTGEPLLIDGRYVGLDVHRAERIASAAHGGQVLLSSATADRVRDELEAGVALRDLGRQDLKDFDEEHLFQLVAQDLRDRFPPLRTGAVPVEELRPSSSAGGVRFVNREHELEALRAQLVEAFAGHVSVALLAGEPGMGKTRLAEELAAEAARRGAEVLWGRCWEGEGAPPFWPWVQILRRLALGRPPLVLRSELGANAGLIAELVPELRERLPDLPPTSLLATEEARFRLFDAIAGFLAGVSRAQPLVLILDDLHLADKPSLLLLDFLQQHVSDARLLVLGSYRDLELGPRHPLAAMLPSLRRGRRFQFLALEGLQEAAVGDFVSSFFDQPLDPRGVILARVLAQETEGNPFFVQEELRFLVENERIVRREGIWTSDVSTVAELGLPEAVREVIARRLSHLSKTCSNLLTEAAVVGREFEVVTLSRLRDVDERHFERALDEAEAAFIIEEMPGPGGRFRFSHALFRETLYTGLRSARRRRLHRAVAEALESEYGGRPEPHLAELAYHFVQGRHDPEKAIAYARRAGEQALASYAYEEAVRHFETALQVQDAAAPAELALRCDLLTALAGALLPSGEARRVADEVAPEALQIGEAIADRHRAFEAARAGIEALLRSGLGSVTVTDVFRTWLDRADRYAEPGSSGRLWVDNRLQFVQGNLGYPGRTWSARMLNLARSRELGDETILCLALNTLLASGTPAQWHEQVELAREYGDFRWQSVAIHQRSAFHVYCAYRFLDAGDRRAWQMLRDEISGLADRTRDRYAHFWTLYQEQERLLIDGFLEDGLVLETRVLRESRAVGMQLAGLNAARRLGVRARLFLGRAVETAALLEQFSEALKQPVDPRDASVVLCQAHLDRQAEVREALDWLLTPDGALADRDLATIVRYLEAAVLVRHREAAGAIAAALAPAADAATCSTAYTCAARHLADAAALQGDEKQALAYAEQGLQVCTRIGNRPEIALCHLQLAELLSETAGAVQAAEHLAFAVAELTRMNMRPSIERATRLQARLLPSINSPTEDSSK